MAPELNQLTFFIPFLRSKLKEQIEVEVEIPLSRKRKRTVDQFEELVNEQWAETDSEIYGSEISESENEE